jgi:hypothetical protein
MYGAISCATVGVGDGVNVGAGEGVVVTDGIATGEGKALLAGWQAARDNIKNNSTFFILYHSLHDEL